MAPTHARILVEGLGLGRPVDLRLILRRMPAYTDPVRANGQRFWIAI